MSLSEDSSSPYTTYSQDTEIEKYLKKLKRQESRINEAISEDRKKKFLNMTQRRSLSIFHLEGLSCKQFNYKIVKFYFQPSIIYKKLSPKIKLYFSFHWLPRYKRWFLKREPLLSSGILLYKRLIDHNLDDDTLMEVIEVVYNVLRRWAKNYKEFRIHRNKLFRQGGLEYFELDSEDELFLTKEERQQVRNKRKTVWKRMIPPGKQGERYSELETTVSTEHGSTSQTSESE